MLNEKAKDPAFWEKVRTSPVYKPMIDELYALWDAECTGDIPACKYSEFIVYDQTGSRREYETSYFVRRRAMNTAALLSLIFPEEEKYIAKLCDVLWAILDEYTWVLPAHMPTFTENIVEFIDLFAAETGCAVSEIDYLLADRLPPLIRSRIRAEVDRRIIAAYTGERRYWWEKSTNNWAAVCIGNVTIAFIYQHPEMVPSILPRVQETLRYFLSGFPEDGICLEGFGYWHYGFGYYLCLADMLRQFSGGEINLLQGEKIRQIARYPQRMYLDGGTTVSFSDSGMTGRYHIGLLHYLKKEFPDEIILPPRALSYSNDGCGRWALHLRAFLWLDESLNDADVPDTFVDYAPVSQWLLRKEKAYSFAAKGGHNSEPHNHNDLGSFIVTKNGTQVLCDPGSGSYNKAYFSKKRYEFFKTSSRGHSVPIIGGQYQKTGRGRSADASFEDGVFTVEISRAYDIPSLTSLRRAFAFTEDTVTLTDTFVFDGEAHPVTERFISRFPAEITDAGVVTGGLTLLADTPAAVTETEGFWCIDYDIADTPSFTLRIHA